MNIIGYFKETREELRHVKWPTRQETINYTALVIGLALLAAALLGLSDVVFAFLLKSLI